jgi:TonB-linked SusC/RagA family outer membrane protein
MVSTEIKLVQKLDFITQGLSVSANVSYDTYALSTGPSITDSGNQGQALYTYINPNILDAKTRQDTLNATFYYATAGATGIRDFDFVLQPWTVSSEAVTSGSLARTLFYQATANYARTFGDHDVSSLFLFNRRQNATGAEFANYREDWVGRVTYNYNDKYFAEFNGAYNGSEKFSSKYRFGFFPSMALGWMISNESFMDQFEWLSKFKIRGSIGQVGSDAGIPRWGYVGSWNTRTGVAASTYTFDPLGTIYASPYQAYIEGTIPNFDIRWETAVKRNIGAEISIMDRLVTLDLDLFKDNRKDIFMTATRRNIPNYFGANAVPANLGATETKGYEIELGVNKTWTNGLGLWIKLGMTKASDVVTKSEDPQLLFDYQKAVGFAISQTRATLRSGFMNNWDDVFASAPSASAMIQRLPGDWDVIDFNGDGVIDSYDSAPYGYPTRPQKTYNGVIGGNYKGFAFVIQFYGVRNINLSPYIKTPSLTRWVAVSEELRDYWTPENTGAYYKAPRLTTGSSTGDWSIQDASFVRLKTMEISYTLPSKLTQHAGLSNCRIYLNGNNLIFWSDFPADFETGSVDINDAYPTYKLMNMGIDISF